MSTPSKPSTPAEGAVFEALAGLSARVAGVARFVPAGATIREGDPLLHSAWARHFLRLPASSEERAVASDALRFAKEAANPPHAVTRSTVSMPQLGIGADGLFTRERAGK